MASKPDLTGPIWSMAAVDNVNSDMKPYFTFQLHLSPPAPPPYGEFPVFYYDLTKVGSHAVATIVAAAYSAGIAVDVFLEKPGDTSMRLAMQVSKPPK
jgi:hypothetical protein